MNYYAETNLSGCLEHPDLKMRMNITYNTDPQFGHVASKYSLWSQFTKAPETKQEFEINPPVPATTDASEFRLPFYGIPESAIGIRSNWTNWRMLSVVLLASLAIGCFLAWKRWR